MSVDYWSALVDPCSIGKFDWSEYVIRKLFHAVVKLKTELQVSNRVSNITGCSIFLQVIPQYPPPNRADKEYHMPCLMLINTMNPLSGTLPRQY